MRTGSGAAPDDAFLTECARRNADLTPAEDEAAQGRERAARVTQGAQTRQPDLYCFVKLIEPESEAEQFVAAYVPVIWLPLTVAVTAEVQTVGILGVKVADIDAPLIEPVNVPLVLPIFG